jgi:uncharacterized protein (DUF58 family)
VAPELSEYRLYRQGDDPRRLDWKLLARSDRAYVRLAEDRAILPTWFVLDASASMAWPPESLAKWALATTMVLGLASVAIAAGDPAGLLVAHPHAVVRLPPRARRGTVREIVAALGNVAPSGAARLAPALREVRPGARTIIVSDFLGDESDARRVAAGLNAAGSEVHAIHVVAQEELEPPRRAVRAVDPVDRAIGRPLEEATYAAYQARFAAWRDETARAWRRAGIAWWQVSTAGDPLREIRRVIGGAQPAAPVTA